MEKLELNVDMAYNQIKWKVIINNLILILSDYMDDDDNDDDNDVDHDNDDNDDDLTNYFAQVG